MDHLDLQLAHQYLRSALPPAEHRHWTQHLQGCPRCRELVAAERNLLAVLKLDADAPPGGRAQTPVDADELLNQVHNLPRRIAPRVLRGVRLLAIIGLAVLLAWQYVHLQAARAALDAPAFEFESDVARNLPALRALAQDGALLADYETLDHLAELLREAPP
jgi:hypothetical protein